MRSVLFKFGNERTLLSHLFGYLIFLILILFFCFSANLKASEEIDSNENLFMEASEAYKNGSYSEAFEKFDALANFGLHDAQYNLAVILKSG